MVRTHAQVLRRQLRRLADAQAGADDADALRRHRAGDPGALADLVGRHGPMVYGVCRRVLGPTPDADDAFQATFLALVRAPGAVRNPNALPAWLHRVALRTARKALARRKPVRPPADTAPSPEPGAADRAAWADVRRALDEELNRLPDSCRAPLVLGATRDEAARRLGWTLATLDRRLAAGRARLRERLARRGLGALALGAAVYADGLRAAVPNDLARAAATLTPAGGAGSAAVRALAVGRATLHAPLAAGFLVFGTLTVIVIGAAGRPAGDEPARPPAPAATRPADAPAEPLPDGAVARMGSTRFRHAGLSEFAYTTDGGAIRTIGTDRVVRAWDPVTGRPTGAVPLQRDTTGEANAARAGPARSPGPDPGLRDTPGTLTLSPDGKTAAACYRNAITVWDAESGKVLASLAGPKVGAGQPGFSPDGKLLAVGGNGGRFTVWDWKAGKEHPVPIASGRSGTDSTFHCHFSPDGKLFVAGLHAQIPLAVFETTTWRKVHEFDCFAVTSVFTPDSKRLIVSSQKDKERGGESILRVLDVGTGKELRQFPAPAIYHSLAVSPDGTMVACGASDQSCLFDLATGRVRHPLTGRPWGLGFSPDGKTFVASAWGTHLRFWDVATGKERYEQPGNFGQTLATAASPDGRLVAAADWMDRAVHVWDTATGRQVGLFHLPGKERYARDLAFSPDGRTLTAGLYEGLVMVWDVATGKELRTVRLGAEPGPGNRPGTYYHSARGLPNGLRAATLDHGPDRRTNTRLMVWDLQTAKPVKEWRFPGESRTGAWSADGQTLAVGLGDRVALVDLETGEERAALEGALSRSKTPPAMSPDTRLVAAARLGEDQQRAIGVYEVATGNPLAALPSDWGNTTFALAADNRTLVTADTTRLRAWDLPTGKEVLSRPLPVAGPDSGTRIGVSGIIPLAGRRVFTPMADGTGLVWDLATPAAAPTPVDEKQLAGWWADLRSDDPAKAYAAVWRLTDSAPESVVPFLVQHLRPEAAPDPAKLRQLVADLDSDTFRVRERAAKELQDLGHAAAPALRKALADKPAPETARRIEQLLARKPDVASRPDQLRRLRAMQVLERIGSPDALRLLADLAAGLPLAPETKEAQAALGRR